MSAFAKELVLTVSTPGHIRKGGRRGCSSKLSSSLKLESLPGGYMPWRLATENNRAASVPVFEGLTSRDKLFYSTSGGGETARKIKGDIRQPCKCRSSDCSSSTLGVASTTVRDGGRSFWMRRGMTPLQRRDRSYKYLTLAPPVWQRRPCPPTLAWWNDFFSKPEKPEDFPKKLQQNKDGTDEIDDLIEDDKKFRSWQRKRQVLEDLRDAQETGRLPDDREWEDWLDDSWGNDYNQKYVGGERSGWYEPQTEWENEGKPRSAPPIPERGMNRTIKELSLLAFFNQEEVEEDITFEERIFRYTSQQTAKIIAVLILVPWFTGFLAHEYLFVPFLDRYVQEVPLAAKLLDCREKQKLDMIETLRLERQRVKFESEIGKTPPLSDEELAEHMHEEAVHLREEVRFENRKAFANIWSDAIALLVFVMLLVFNPKQVNVLRITGDRIFTNVSDMGKAFLIILFTDIFLGYHSESGWETLVEIFLDHYGLEASQASIYIFIAIVPVSIDAFFKLWVFRALRKLSPSAAATFSQMKRH